MMKQQCWKQLTSQLCPKQKWVKDQDQLACQHCSKQFIPLVRRRHHCRFCGNIFCSGCSDFFLNGNYLGLKQKFTRHCEFCHQKIQKFIKDCVRMPEVYEEDNTCIQNSEDQEQEQDQQFLEIDPQQQIYNLNQIFGENQKKICSEVIRKLDEQLKAIIDSMSIQLCKKFSLDSNLWSKKLSQIALKAAIQTKMDTFTSEGPYQSSMDIVKQVKIKTLVTQPDKITAILLKGIVLDKNLPSKHMTTHLTKPKILIIQSSIDIQSFSSDMKFEDLLKNQKVIMKKILQKICKISPDIIFVQGNVNFEAIQYFQQKKICVVNKIKKKDLQSIMEVSSIRKTVRKLWMIQRYKIPNILGSCDKIYFKAIKEGQSMMFVQADVGVRTIILGEATQQLVNYLKRTMQLLLRFSRQLNLEKYLISVDSQLFLTLPRSLKFPFITELNQQIYKCPEKFALSQQVSFTKVIFGQIKYTIAPKNFIQYGQKQGKSIFYQNCQGVQYQRKKIYASGDITLGGYLLLNIALNQKQCRKCQYTHSQRYYFPDNVIIVRYLKKVNTINVKSSFAQLQIQNSQDIVTLQRLKGALKKQKQKLVIETCIYCDICQTDLNSQSIKVGKNYLENSFFYFLELMSKSWAPFFSSQKQLLSKQKTRPTNKVKVRKISIQKCNHDTLSRVFIYSGNIVKFSIKPYVKYNIFSIRVQSQEGKSIISKNEQKFKQSLKQSQVSEKQAFFDEILKIVHTLPIPNNPNSSFSVAYSSIKIVQKMQRFNRVIVILQNLMNEFRNTKSLKIEDDWTLFLRDIYKYQSVMKYSYQIVQYIQTFLKKRKLQEKGQIDKSQPQLLGQDLDKLQKFDKIQRRQSYKQNSQFLEQDNNSVNTRQNSQTNMSIMSLGSTIISPGNDNNGRQRLKNEVDSKSNPVIKKIRKQRFPLYQGNILKYKIGYTYDPVSILACALNSVQFITYANQNSKNLAKEGKDNKQLKESRDVLNFKLQFSCKIKTSFPLKQQMQAIHKEIFQSQSQQNKIQTYEMTVFFPDQFQKLRVREGVDFETYVKSLCGCKSWDSSGGKSNSSFAKSHNQILVVKIINNKQFVEFKKFAQDYLNYIQKAKLQNKDSLLAKIYGIYEITMRSKQYKCIVMENLFFGVNNITKVYDLKGSEVNRLTMPEGDKGYTGQDTNFKIDKDNNPYILENQEYNHIIQVLEADSKFLSDQQVIDYSLLVIQSLVDGKYQLRLGIIDFMRPYHIFQKIENLYKKTKMGNDPTVIPPGQYSERFFASMKKYFIKVN